jgi:SAM-dependent methyltransferase
VNTRDGLRGSRDPAEVSPASRLVTDRIAAFYSRAIPQCVRGPLLDLGCGQAPLYGLYQQFATEITCVDWSNSPHPIGHIDIIQDINEPLDALRDGQFQTVILSDVLEHTREPREVMAEIARVLEVGGYLLMSVPFMYWIHEAPHDYYRYTSSALDYLAEKAGLEVLEIRAVGGAIDVLCDVVSKSLMAARQRVLAGALQSSVSRLTERRYRDGNGRTGGPWPLAYTMIAVRK